MFNEIEESAKAVQEVAKTTSKGIEATEKLGGFLAKITKEPLEEMIGVVTDKLRFMRWERRLRLTDRANELIKERGLENNNRIVPPKIALPIVENASLEENDELQDLWANLLVSALDPNFDGKLRTAFIDILKQLEVVDVHILNFIYSYEGYKSAYETYVKNNSQEKPLPQIYPKRAIQIQYKFVINDEIYRASIKYSDKVKK